MSTNKDTITFSEKGQIVIPAWLRKEFHIAAGTKAVVRVTPEGILLVPVTRESIAKLRGILPKSPGEKSLLEDLAESRSDDRAIEDRQRERHGA